MDQLFPFGFPWPTAMYLALFVVTAAVYLIFMQYVLGGALVILAGSMVPWAWRRAEDRSARSRRSGLGLIVTALRDGMPAMLGLAIAAGVAPWVLLQVLYRRASSPANLLWFHPLMLLVPALIVGSSLLYLIRGRRLAARGPVARAAVTLIAFICILYTAWAWTQDHVSGIRSEAWGQRRAAGRWIFRDAEIWPRLGFWMTASLATTATVLAWQLHWGRRRYDPAELDLAMRRLRALGLLGLATSAAEAWLWQLWLDPTARQAILGILAMPYGLLAFAGMGVQAAGWLTIQAGSDLNPGRLAPISAGGILTILGALAVREARRLAAIDITTLFEAHRRAARVGGLGVLLAALAIDAAVIVACVLFIRRAPRPRT